MSVNLQRPHLLVLPEDDANRQIANGFMLDPSLNERNVQVLPPANGWRKVREDFIAEHIPRLRRFPHQHLAMLIDFDDDVQDRHDYFRTSVPKELHSRVFVLGCRSEPEPLRVACRLSFEKIGKTLSAECYGEHLALWNHDLLAHNANERQRLSDAVKSFLFNHPNA